MTCVIHCCVADIEWHPDAVEHMRQRHGVTPEAAEEAMNDPHALMRSSDPASRSKMSDRYVGWSATREEVLVVIVVRYNGRLYGGNAWPANEAHRKLYDERRADE